LRTAVTLAVDIGGTFTDVALLDGAGGLWRHKLSTTVGDEAAAVVEGSLQVLAAAGVESAEVARIVHGSTICTNAILEGSGPRVGLVTTRGFRDVLEIARIRTPQLYDLGWQKPAPLVLRRHRYEVEERVGAAGEVVAPLLETSVEAAIEALRAAEITAVAVCLINAPVNALHELAVRDLFTERYPEASISLSSDVLCELKEYERTSTTVVNAYLRPVLQRYLGGLQERLREAGLGAPLHVMRSDGGMMSVEAACDKPVFAVVSGPAAGVVAAREVAIGSARRNVLAFDMGGTTAKASLIEDGQLPRVNEYEVRDGISTPSRFVKAGGYLLMAPSVDLAEVGNGAGSRARVDAGSALRVGPESAGADPGPACYGLGGVEPTITDANVVLGYLNPEFLLGGKLPIRFDLAEKAIRTLIAEPLGVDLMDAAWGIHAVANSNMIRAIRAVTVERGRDPRTCSLVAFGGSGPVHAAVVAREMWMGEVIVPRSAGLLSAVGLLEADVEHHLSRAWLRALEDVSFADLRAELCSLERDARHGFDVTETDGLVARTLVDLRYVGQATAVTVQVPADMNDVGLGSLIGDFEREYERTYRHRLSDEPIEIVTLRVTLTAVKPERLRFELVEEDGAPAGPVHRAAYFGPGVGFIETPVHRRSELMLGTLPGPVLIDEYDTTIVVPPGVTATLTQRGDVVLRLR
jgi:N-methylhydantoinase A